MVKYLYIIMGILGGPIGLIMGPDPYYYAVMPLVIETVAPYGITAAQVAKAMLIGENVVLSVSPCVPANYLAFGISGIDLNDHMKFSFKWEWLVSILMLIFALVVGMVLKEIEVKRYVETDWNSGERTVGSGVRSWKFMQSGSI